VSCFTSAIVVVSTIETASCTASAIAAAVGPLVVAVNVLMREFVCDQSFIKQNYLDFANRIWL